MPSLFGQYLKERYNKEILETDKGFATYSFRQDSIYIEDVYIVPEHRRKHETFSFADQISEIAKSKNLKKLLGSVIPSLGGSTERLQGLFAYGFKVVSCSNDFILLEKDLI